MRTMQCELVADGGKSSFEQLFMERHANDLGVRLNDSGAWVVLMELRKFLWMCGMKIKAILRE